MGRTGTGGSMVALALALALAGPAAAQTTVCLPGEYTGDGLQLAVDARGTVHLARVDRVGEALIHTAIAPDGAAVDTVVAPRISRFSVDEVRDLGLLVEPGPQIHICAYDAVNRRFEVSTRRAGVWRRTAVDAGPRVGASCDLARVDGGLLAAWHGEGTLRAGLLPDGGAWQVVEVDAVPEADVGGRPSIAVGPAGRVAIAHLDATHAVLRISAAVAEGPIDAWQWGTTALDVGGWHPAAFFAGEALHVWHGGVPDDPDNGSDVAVFGTTGPASGPFRTGPQPGFDLGGSLDAARFGDGMWLFVRGRTRSALFGAYDGLYLDAGPVDGPLARQTLAESGPAGQRHRYQFLQVAPDPFGSPVLAWFDDAAGGFGQPASARTCYRRADDTDADAVPDAVEAERGTDPARADTDGDGRTDGEELLIDGTDPLVGPGGCAVERCNGRDDDCDGLADEGLDGAPCDTGALGACAAGRVACVDGDARCVPLRDAGEEACGGLDGDCDGRIDEGRQTCGLGVCAVEADRCLDGAPVPCTPGAPLGDDRTCDGLDDDCDGRLDEAYAPRLFGCGEGACAVEVPSACVAGRVEVDCTPPAGAARDGTCDDIDDDCDGIADEDTTPVPVRCGVGACRRDGTTVCRDGGLVEQCEPGAPTPDDDCDGIDDDCDGIADEAFDGGPTACGAGACAAVGALRCVDGARVDTCRPGDPASIDDTCDGFDDDCDGIADEAFAAVSACGEGVCRAGAAVLCRDGAPVDLCRPGAPTGDDADCDGLDDDCDGAVDEAAPSEPIACGVGACRADGARRCDEGVVLDDCRPGAPLGDDADCDGVDGDCDGRVDEAGLCACGGADDDCDGRDDDCDGRADEGFADGPVDCGVGACAADGFERCVGGALQRQCAPGEPSGDDADCDGVDDDCDGIADEGFPAGPITCGVGVCAAEGTVRCVGGRVIERCTPGFGRADDPICNGLDDDCDGTVDEGAAPSPITCGVGACARDGRHECRRGRYVDRCTPGQPSPEGEGCDGIDDDCDGIADEGFVSVEVDCGVGACAARGRTVCAGGAVRIDCAPGAPAADDALCDGLDADCDGAVDEDHVGREVRCGVGACAASARTICVDGLEVDPCAPGAPGDDDDCDGRDGDCDGAVDEGFAEAPVLCGRGACEAVGARRCVGGAVEVACTPGDPGPFDAECDGIDADCDGRLDEDHVAPERRCGVGACARAVRDQCLDGIAIEVQCRPGAPAAEDGSCDGVDDDCDGVTDEDCAADAGAADARVADAEPPDAQWPDAEPPDAARPDAEPPDAALPDAEVEDDAGADAMPDAMTDAMTDAIPDAMPDAIPDADADATLDIGPDVAPDAMPDRAPDARPGPSDGGLDPPDAVRLDYALTPLDDLVAPRDAGCFARVGDGPAPRWPALLLLAALLRARRTPARATEGVDVRRPNRRAGVRRALKRRRR